ncbi:glycosyltransferase [Aeromicrobium sp.]|uniref:glycosyltransferase n=1 Tax=Aeromicrobium sp. TaxID=1871063 RepID=UPI002FC8E9B2
MASAGPAISILTPSYNAGDYLVDAVRSALEQMRADDELLIQDAGSTDGSIERIAAEFAAYPQLKIVSEPDDGQADALNRALRRAGNPVMGWLNADDLLHPGALDAVRRAWELHPEVKVVFGSWYILAADGTLLRHKVPTTFEPMSLLWRPTVFSGAIFAKTDAVREVGGFDAGLYFVMDGDLWMRLAQLRSAVQIPETLAGFRWYTGSKTGGMDAALLREGMVYRRRYAVGLRGKALSYVAFVGDCLWFLAVPLRKASWYSNWRLRRSARTRPEPAGRG